MQTRSLRDRPWLVADDRRHDELALKRSLLLEHRDRVLVATESSRTAGNDLVALIEQAGLSVDPNADEHSLAVAGLSVQEDLCLLQRRSSGWFLDSASLSFPTRWLLQDKVNRHIAEVHAPVGGYTPRINGAVDRLFDQLTDRPVWRRNWFLMSNPALFQPERQPIAVMPQSYALTRLYVRSERQTLRLLPCGWIVFTIRIQQATLRAALNTPERVSDFRNWVENVPADFAQRRHVSDAQRGPLLAALTAHEATLR